MFKKRIKEIKALHLEAFLNDLGFFFSKVTECDSSSSFYTKSTQNASLNLTTHTITILNSIKSQYYIPHLKLKQDFQSFRTDSLK